MAVAGTKGSLERDCEAMTLQQPPPALRGGCPPGLYIHSMPAWVLEDFCQKMDCLSDYDWMRFASYVIPDQTELRKIKCLERTGISVTRELMWWWGVRLATVQQLLDLLQGLQLYRAAQVILDWTSASSSASSAKEELVQPPKQEHISLTPPEITKREGEKELSLLPSAGSSHLGAAAAGVSGAVAEGAFSSLPAPPPPPRDLLNSLQSNPPVASSVKPCSSPSPQQETVADLPSGSLLWSQQEVTSATNSFSEKSRIGEGTFADVYKGQRNEVVYAIKRLRETECTSPSATQRFFHTEVQICFRCCHVNILQLLGFSIESGLHCLIYPYLPNGSLHSKLHSQESCAALPWEARVGIAAGLLQAVHYLHGSGILHGNIKSSNVLLDDNLTPKLGHSGLRLLSADRKSEYAMMKTKVLQASLTYLPEDLVRHGQLAARVDVFSCAVVLAEILTGMKALDEGRQPAYLKDLVADEMQLARESCSKGTAAEKLAAREICCKYLDTRAGPLLEEAAVDFASAICICLRKKNPSIAEALGTVGTAESKLREHSLWGGSTTGLSSNTPEETDDETSSMSREVPPAGGKQPLALSSAPPCPPLLAAACPDPCCEPLSRVPCESDESGSFLWEPADTAAEELQSSSCHTSAQAAASALVLGQDRAAAGLQQRSAACSSQEPAVPSSLPPDSAELQPPCAQALPRETSWGIKINDQKRKLMQNILLYEEDKLSSSELFDS
ncbi:interleukin-1 receptor-associated kinase-like 2 [Melanerpes formicivorus]|uniref:interleukin-1 receptor-associated kinase-like 2 n=1 Tax=Melanerpes formicivorus TaxID=211600 RepID=UPI00358E79F8